MPLEPEVEKLYRSAMRQRLTRAGLLKIMKENEKREALKGAPEKPVKQEKLENSENKEINNRKDER